MGLLVAIVTVGLALLGVPLFVVMLVAAMSAYALTGGELSVIGIEIYKMAAQPTILAIPTFTFAGYMMAESDSPKRLLRFAEAALGRLPGGVAIVALIVCAFFTAFTGASGVTIIALGGLMYPILSREGHSEKFSLGLITTSGSLGLLFPPSLPVILYGMVSGVDIETLFRAAFVPGLLLIGVLSLWSVYNSRHLAHKRPAFSWRKLSESFKGCFWELLLPVGILYGIYSGHITVTEAAVTTAFYVFVMECLIYRDLHITRDIPRIMCDCMSLVGSILLILCCALGFTNFLVDEEIPMHALELMRTFLTDKYTFLICLNVFLLLVGAFMDIFSAIIVVVPLVAPIAQEFGINPFHLAVIFLTNLELGYITPPIGINLFISGLHFKRPMSELYRVCLPFLGLLLLALLLITFIPALSLWAV